MRTADSLPADSKHCRSIVSDTVDLALQTFQLFLGFHPVVTMMVGAARMRPSLGDAGQRIFRAGVDSVDSWIR